MISFNTPNILQQFHTGTLINRHITVQAAAEVTGYNIQYLRRNLRSGALRGVKIGQMWLLEMDPKNRIYSVWKALQTVAAVLQILDVKVLTDTHGI